MKRLMIASAAGICLAPAAMAETAVKFGTNWVAQGEHGGYYQAVEDGSYKECGLDVTIVPGGPQVNNRAMMLAGKVDFNMAGNLLSTFNAAAERSLGYRAEELIDIHTPSLFHDPGEVRRRAEELSRRKTHREQYDVAVSRALAAMPMLARENSFTLRGKVRSACHCCRIGAITALLTIQPCSRLEPLAANTAARK